MTADLPPLPDSPVAPPAVYDEKPREYERYGAVLNKQREQNEALRVENDRLYRALASLKTDPFSHPDPCPAGCAMCRVNAVVERALRGET